MTDSDEIREPRGLPVFVVDGATFDDFAGFQRVVTALLDNYSWTGSLDAFNDILRGGFGTPENGWIWQWVNADLSRGALGYPATAARLQEILQTCHPANRREIAERLRAAELGEGPTLFDELVEIIKSHGPGGAEAEDCVFLELR